MKKDLIEEINSLPPLPSSVIELEKYKSIGNTDIKKLISIIEILKKLVLIYNNLPYCISLQYVLHRHIALLICEIN